MNANEILERHYLEVRAKLLEVAATLDRIDRADGPSLAEDIRLGQLMEGLKILQDSSTADRAEQVQHLFSRPYDDQWRTRFEV